MAAACNSKLKLRQKRLRSASPQALLMRPPKGAWMISCIPPPSSKKRSAMIVSLRGHSSQHGAALQDVFDGLLGAGIVQSAFLLSARRRSPQPQAGSARCQPEKCRAGDR